MDSKSKGSKLANQWGAIAAFGLLRDLKCSKSQVTIKLDENIAYLKNPEFSKYLKDIPENFDNLTSMNIRYFRSTIETLINGFLNDNNRLAIIDALSIALRSAIVFASRTVQPGKEVSRNRTPLKSGLSVPKDMLPYMSPLLKYLISLVKDVPDSDVTKISQSLFDLSLDLIFKRPSGTGPDGELLSILSKDQHRGPSIWINVSHIAKQKQSDKVVRLLNSIVLGVGFIRNVDRPTVQDLVSTTISLKGKWSQTILFPFVTKTLAHYKETNGGADAAEQISQLYNTILKYTLDNPTKDWYIVLFNFMRAIPEKDFLSTLNKIVSSINKQYSKLTATVYFLLIGFLFDAAAQQQQNVRSEVFKLLFKAWFDKKFNMQAPFSSDSEQFTHLTPKIDRCTHSDLVGFFDGVFKSGNTSTIGYCLVSIHTIAAQTKSDLKDMTDSMTPVIEKMISSADITQENIQLVVPLLSLLWQNVPAMHPRINVLMSRLVKNNDVVVLGHASAFFSDLMENYAVNTMSISVITTFAVQFLKRTDYDESPSEIVNGFALYQSFLRSFLLYAGRADNAVDNESWHRVLRATEVKLIIYAFFPDDRVRRIVDDIWAMLRTGKAITYEGIQPLAAVIDRITAVDLGTIARITTPKNFEQRYFGVAQFYTSTETKQKLFRVGLSRFLYALYRGQYFVQNEGMKNSVLKKVTTILAQQLLPGEIFDITNVVPPAEWPALITAVTSNDTISLREKCKFVWAMSANRFFSRVLVAEETLTNLSNLVVEFCESKAPTNEGEQALDVAAAEFSASFIRAAPVSLKTMPQFQNAPDQLRMFISRLNPDSITLPDISHVFAMLELVHTYVDTWPLSDDALTQLLDWTLYIALKTKGSPLLQLKCHDLLRSVIAHNKENLALILRCCFRASIHTTAHVASAIATSDIPENDLAVLALGLAGRPNIISRAIAAEIANLGAPGTFSPLDYLKASFEEELVDHYASKLDASAVRKVFGALPEIVGHSGQEPHTLPHCVLLQRRLTSFPTMATVEKLLQLTAITDFADLAPIKPLIPLWDLVWEKPPGTIQDVFNMLMDKIDALTNAPQLTATCIAFSRAFLKNSKQTAAYLVSHLRVAKDPKLTFDGFVPTKEELVASAAISYIFTLETDPQRFNVCWMANIHFILTWAIFLRFNPLYEHHQLPPLLMAVMHAAVPTSEMKVFVMPATECVARAVYLPFRHSVEFTIAQMEELLATLRKNSQLTAELFLDVCADKAASLTKYSADFWLLFANFFQPRHSKAFLNKFMESAQAGDLTTVGNMLPILTGVVRQKAPAQNIGGFVVVIIFVVVNSKDPEFLKLITRHLAVFVDTIEKEADCATIAETLDSVVSEHGGEEAIVEGVLHTLCSANDMSNAAVSHALQFLREIARILSHAKSKFSVTAGVLYAIDSIRRLESGNREPMICQQLLGIDAPSSYEDLAVKLNERWPANTVSYILGYLVMFVARSSIPLSSFSVRVFNVVMAATKDFIDRERLPKPAALGQAIAHEMVGAENEDLSKLTSMAVTEITTCVNSIEDFPDFVSLVAPTVEASIGKMKRIMCPPTVIKGLVPAHAEATLVDVCEFIKNNILT